LDSALKKPTLNFENFNVKNKFILIFIGFILNLIFRVDITTPILYYFVLFIALSVYFSVFIIPKKMLIYPIVLIIYTSIFIKN
jgi:hypothetical protein